MPLYEFECPKCVVDDKPHRFEEIHSMTEVGKPVMCACGEMATPIISTLGEPLVAHTFTTYGHDGRIIGQKQTTERTAFKLRTNSGKVVNM